MKTDFRITYKTTDVSRDFAPFLKSISFKEHLSGKAATLELGLDNSDFRFWKDWQPEKSDKITASLGYENNLLDCGSFFVEGLSYNSMGSDECRIRAMNISPNNIYNKKNYFFHNAVLTSDLVSKIANKLGVKASVKLPSGDKVTIWQKDSDIQFLNKLAKLKGAYFKIENEKLVFWQISEFSQYNTVLSVSRNECKSYNFDSSAIGDWGSCTVKWFDEKTKKTYSGTYAPDTSKPQAEIWVQISSDSEGKERAKQWLTETNKDQQTINITIAGDIRIRAGIQIDLTDFGNFSGNYYVSEVSHNLNDSGYTTNFKLIANL